MKCTALVRTCFVVISAGVFGVGADDGVGCLVERMFIFVLRMCPLAVATDLGRCLRTRSAVRPGQVAKKPWSMAAIHVDGTGLNAAW